MSKKNVTFREDPESKSQPFPSKPQTIHLRNLSNHSEPVEIANLRLRIEDLQSKVTQLEAKLRTKRKRIRRRSCDVQKKHRCEFCKKLYGSLVSLNLHVRIKHRKQKQELDKNKPCQTKKDQPQEKQQSSA